ncbi:hypothetical protein C5167_042328 [Papaver somniferum]|uniref:Uncharacterized protein n=1 Tax=Papaver somniferum TaxID=3469 RepID=A0A4Y7L542_PAPSO|nr:hypothetical protein C5167_042328 [Papaver somniferum]
MSSPSKGRTSEVIIEETDDDKKPANMKGNGKRSKENYLVSDSDVDDEEIIVKDHFFMPMMKRLLSRIILETLQRELEGFRE